MERRNGGVLTGIFSLATSASLHPGGLFMADRIVGSARFIKIPLGFHPPLTNMCALDARSAPSDS